MHAGFPNGGRDGQLLLKTRWQADEECQRLQQLSKNGGRKALVSCDRPVRPGRSRGFGSVQNKGLRFTEFWAPSNERRVRG